MSIQANPSTPPPATMLSTPFKNLEKYLTTPLPIQSTKKKRRRSPLHTCRIYLNHNISPLYHAVISKQRRFVKDEAGNQEPAKFHRAVEKLKIILAGLHTLRRVYLHQVKARQGITESEKFRAGDCEKRDLQLVDSVLGDSWNVSWVVYFLKNACDLVLVEGKIAFPMVEYWLDAAIEEGKRVKLAIKRLMQC
ncbi:hypothetical protein K470DRAFT_259024 [Piedraia hortae CBS 480.64]|uniref:Uncharacterized protein n=1 Tax=Piedraia hortae CBS 480.64 TaxID=1314780 RepID=A0A6A7BW31_9PEZI|nr:hypothetical protein K470DRAFT_259024 [Piedraia hortae CBS 480.64]